MNKNVKGSLAAAAAAVVLLGGAGSLAYWNDAQTVTGGTIGAGSLKLNAASCNTAGWTVSNTLEKVVDQPFAATDLIVPGDVLTKKCNVEITATGKNLRANLSASAPTAAGSMAAGDYVLSSSFVRDGQTITSVKSSDAVKTINATITLAFPIKAGVDNASQLKNVVLNDITVTATQATTVAP